MSGLPSFARTVMDDLAPAYYTGSARSVCWHTEDQQPDCVPFWSEPDSAFGSLTFDDAYGSSHGLGVSSRLALRPP